MSHQTVEEIESARVKPRRIDAPHSVGGPSEGSSISGELEFAAVGHPDVLWQTEAEEAFDPAMPETGPDALSLTEISSLPRKPEEYSTLDESLAGREEQLENQAAQLADQLQGQLRDLEHREANLNARAAELDNEFRRARLWAQEQVAQLHEREAAVEPRLTEVIRREEELASREQTFLEREVALAPREGQLEGKEANIRERRQSIEREAAALHHARQEWERSRDEEQADLSRERASIREELEAEFSGRTESLARGEGLLAEHTRELEKDRMGLSNERTDWQRQKAADREAIAVYRQRTEAELEQRRNRLTTRETALDQQQGALDQLRTEITAAHRQSIEMRLMAEQLWAQVQGRMPPVEITQSIAQLRLKLGEQYRLEQQGLAEQKEELLKLAEKVAEQSLTLRTQRHELQTWFAAREEEIERHAELLVSRERELLEQSDQLRETESSWNTDRRQLEQELRDMHSRMRQAAA